MVRTRRLRDRARDPVSPPDLCRISPDRQSADGAPARNGDRWFAEAGALPQRVSTCNSLSVTTLTILQGTAIGLVPVRVMQDELERGR